MSEKMVKVGCSLLEDIQSGKLRQLEVDARGNTLDKPCYFIVLVKTLEFTVSDDIRKFKNPIQKGKVGKQVAIQLE